MGKIKDLTGQRFGELVAIEPTNRRSSEKNVMWHCVCSCGQHILVNSAYLLVGGTLSCGHLATEIRRQRILKAAKENNKEGTNLGEIGSRKPFSTNKSGVRGVAWEKRTEKWVAHLSFKGERKLYKRFTNKQDAIDARKEAEKKYFNPVLKKYDKVVTA